MVVAQVYILPCLLGISVISIYKDLEGLIHGKKIPDFKSEGERRIASFLDCNSIRYQYEPGVLVSSPYDKPRIWYPDFYLPEVGIYIEYYGLVGKQNYDRGIKKKKAVYSQMGLDVIPVYPWTFSDDWKGYIMKELEHVTSQRYRNLMTKPYWAQRRYPLHVNVSRMQNAYRPRSRNRY
jgi:hypothetical protein